MNSGGINFTGHVASVPSWLRAEHLRSVGMNKQFGLGGHHGAGHVPAPPPPPKPHFGAPPPPPGPDITSQINDIINPQVQGLQSQKAAYDKQQVDYQNSLTGYYAALGKILQGMSPAVSSAYNSAASTMGQLGQGLTGQARTLENQQNAQDQKILANAGQTQASGYVGQHAAPGEAALNPFYESTGKIPGDTFAQVGAAKATEAAQQPLIWASRGRDALTEAISKAVAGDQQYQDKIANIYAQVPALRDKIMSEVKTQEQATQDYNLKLREVKDTEKELGIRSATAQATARQNAQKIGLQEQKLQSDIAHWNAQLQNSALDRQTRLQIAAQRNAAQVQLTKLRGQQARQTALWKKQNGIGASDSWGKQASAIEKQAKYLFDHPKTKAQKDAFGHVVKGASYPPSQTIFNSLWSTYVGPYLRTVPANQRASARSMAKREVLNAMAAAGFPLPGRKK